MTHIVLIPGLLCTPDLYIDFANALGNSRAKCIPAPPPSGATLMAMAEALLALTDKPVVLMGTSLGGYVALAAAAVAPDRVRGLILCNTSARADTPEQSERRLQLMSLASEGRFHGLSARTMSSIVGSAARDLTRWTNLLQSMGQRVGADLFITEQRALLGRPDQRASLPALRAPVLIIAGTEDRLTPWPLSLELFERIERADLHILAGCGHLAPLEFPDDVAALVGRWMVREQLI